MALKKPPHLKWLFVWQYLWKIGHLLARNAGGILLSPPYKSMIITSFCLIVSLLAAPQELSYEIEHLHFCMEVEN